MRFRTTIFGAPGRSATGIPFPAEVVEALGGGKRPAVRVTLNGYTYATTLGSMGGQVLAPLAAEHRTAAGVAAGEEHDVDVELDAAPRTVETPGDLAAALAKDAAATATFEKLAPSHRKEYVRWITEAKKAETRATRVARAVDALRDGKNRY